MNIRNEILKLARMHEDLRPHLLPILKKAVQDETSDFVDWIILTRNDEKMSPAAVEHFLDQSLGIKPRPYDPEKVIVKKGPILELGDTVRVDASKAPPVNQEVANLWANQIGRIAKVNKDRGSVLVRFDRGEAEFFGLASASVTGLYRHTTLEQMNDAVLSPKMIELVYFSKPGEVGAYRKSVVDSYVQKGLSRGEERSRNYHTGRVKSCAYGKDGTMYFTLESAQRPYPVSVNPEKGELLYIGILNKRPSWQGEFSRAKSKIEQISLGR